MTAEMTWGPTADVSSAAGYEQGSGWTDPGPLPNELSELTPGFG